MDILKKVHANPEACQITGDVITVQGKAYDATQIVDFPTKKTKEYTLKSAAFFLINAEMSLRDYMSLCKSNEIASVSHVDKSAILSEVMSYVPIAVKGFFVGQKPATPKSYDVPGVRIKDIIIVPGSLISKIHVDNVERLLTDGVLESTTGSPLSKDSKQITVAGKEFTVMNNPDSLQKDEWLRVRAVFIENASAPESEAILLRCPKDAVIFTLEQELFNSVRLELSNEMLRNHKQILEYFR